MMIDFYEVFGDDADKDYEIPQEILEELNKELPDNLFYLQDESGEYRVVSKSGQENSPIKIKTVFDLDPEKDALLIERLKAVPYDKVPEYLYRIQKALPVKDVKIGNDEKLIPLNRTVGNPLSDEEAVITQCKMYPSAFPEPMHLLLDSGEGDKVCIAFQQVPYDSLYEIKFENIDFLVLKIEIYVYSPLIEGEVNTKAKTSKDNPVSVTYSVTPSRASSVSMALVALRLFKGFFNGTTQINGKMLTPVTEDKIDSQKLEGAFDFWTEAADLEKKLGVKFIPGAEFPAEDEKLFSELVASLIDNRKIVWKHPFDHFSVSSYDATEEDWTMDNVINKDKVYFQFIEGPISCTLLGTQFEIYSYTEMEDLIVTNIEWKDKTKQKGEVYVTDAPGKTWTLKRLYLTKEKADEFRMKGEK